MDQPFKKVFSAVEVHQGNHPPSLNIKSRVIELISSYYLRIAALYFSLRQKYFQVEPSEPQPDEL